MQGNIGGQPWANIFYVQTDTPGITTSAGVVDMLEAFRDAWSTADMNDALHSSYHVTQLNGIVQTGPSSAVQGQVSASITGGAGGTALPANECYVLSWLSEAFWRGGKPRTYVPGLTTGNIDTNHSLADSDKAVLISRAQTFLTTVNAITTPAVDETTMGFVSFQSGGAWRSPALFFPYNDVTVHDRLGTQRRRLGPWLP